MTGKRNHRAFGWVRKLPSKRYQASYLGPDGQRHLNPSGTFTAKIDAEGWLAREKRLIESDAWTPPADRKPKRAPAAVTFGEYAAAWLEDRTLKPRTKDHYASLLTNQLNPTFESTSLKAI